MASVKISALPLATSVAATDLVVVVADPSTAPTTKKSLASTLPISTLTQTALDLKAPLASPAFTSIPTAPTASADTSSTQLATCAFVVGQAGSSNPLMDGVAYAGTSLRYARQDHVHPSDTSRAPLASPTFTGIVTIPNGASITGYAQFASPAFTGIPTSPTASADTSSTQLATCAFVVGQAGSSNPLMDGTVAVGTSLRYARQDHVHPTDTSLASISNPTFTGTPAAPTAAVDTSTTQLATCAFVVGQAGSDNPVMDGSVAVGTSLRYSRQDHVHPTDTSLASLNSPAFTGIPTAPTASAATNTDQIATTAFVRAEVSALVGTAAATLDTLGELADALGSDAAFSTTIATSLGLKAPIASPTFTGTVSGITKAMVGLTSVDDTADTAKPVSTAQQTALDLKANLASPTFTGTVTIPSGASIAGFAPLASPALTSTPTAPTASVDTSSTQLATCAFVVGQAGSSNPLMDGTATSGTSARYARQDHIHASDTSRAPLASPTFTGTVTIPSGASISGYAQFASPAFTGIPTSPTASADTSSTQLATCAFVVGQAGSSTPQPNGTAAIGTSLRYSRQDHVHATDTSLASISNPTFTGTPAAPTASADDTSTQIATCQFVTGQAGSDNPTMDGAVAAGTSLRYSRQDHVHPTDTSLAPLASPTFTGTVTADGNVITGNTIRLSTARTPSSASDTGNTGEICWDTDYVYVCVSTDTWKRSSISTW